MRCEEMRRATASRDFAMGFCVWITGLPGSGKTSIAKGFLKIAGQQGIRVEYLQLDAIRKEFVPNPKYDEAERDFVYSKLVERAAEIAVGGNVLIDATGHRRRWRDAAREKIPNFREVFVRCPLEVCIERETNRNQNLVMKKIYEKALLRLKTGKKIKGLGEVVGVDVPFEEGNADLVIDSDPEKNAENGEKIYELVKDL